MDQNQAWTFAGVLNRCRWFKAQYGRPQRMAFATSPAFVDHVWQLLGALLSGEALAGVVKRKVCGFLWCPCHPECRLVQLWLCCSRALHRH